MTENKILDSMIRQPISPELQAAYDAASEYLSDIDLTHSKTTAEMIVNEAFHAFVNTVRERFNNDWDGTTPHPLRKEIGGMSLSEDRLWKITTPDFVGGLTEYSGEITGITSNLKDYYTNGTFHWFSQECAKKGWKLEDIEDRKGFR